MVNKVVLVFIAVIALTAMAVGAFVGMELGGPTAGSPTGPPGSETPTGAPAAGTPTPTATSTGTPTATPTPTPVPGSSIDSATLEAEIVERVNARRSDEGVVRLSRGDQLREMARFHSGNMAAQGFLSHAARGFSTAERYEEFGLADRCTFADDTNTGTREDQELEVIGRVTLGVDGTDESELAATIVARWFDAAESRTKLTYQNADQLGVGANVTDAGRAYLTVDLC